jgi:hypothetical protein
MGKECNKFPEMDTLFSVSSSEQLVCIFTLKFLIPNPN